MPILQLVNLSCWCGLPISTSEEHFRNHKKPFSHVDIYCPVGHTPSWRKSSDAEEVRRAKAEAASLRAALDQTDAELTHEKRSHAATKGTLTKTKKRIASGVCPCCNRSFANVARHMKGQHPEYVEEHGLPAEPSS